MPDTRFMKNFQAMLRNWIEGGVISIVGSAAPKSGSGSTATGLGVCGPGSRYTNTATGVQYVNEGTAANPYWTPTNFSQAGLLCGYTDWRDGVGIAVAGGEASALLAGSGLRVFGTALPINDGGITVAQGLGGAIASLFAGATSGVMLALGFGGTTVPFKPSTMGQLVIDAEVAQLTAVTLRRWFFGFVGTAADALVSPVTGLTVTLTNVQTDLAGLMFDVALTAATSIFATRNKANDNPTLLVSATGVATGAVVAADTYQRFRVEIDADGNARFFIDKILVSSVDLAVTPATALAPVLALHSTSAAAKTMLVKRFATWANRV